jgi:putative membrane protein
LVPVRNGQSEVESPFLLRYSHHLTGTRPLIQRAPLCDILPEGYLASKSRTRNRVRFAGDRHQQAEFADVSNIEVSSSGSSTSDASESGDEKAPVDGKDGIEMDDLVTKTRRAASKSAGRIARTLEHDAQMKQLNVAPSSPSLTTDFNTYVIDHQPGPKFKPKPMPASSPLVRSPLEENIPTTRSSLSRSIPANLPLDILRMIESYVNSLHLANQIDVELVKTSSLEPLERLPRFQLGHTIPQSEKLHKSLRSLSKLLGEAEMLSEDPPPLSLSIHLNHLVMLYLLAIPAQVMPILGRWSVLLVLVAGWALLGVEALCREVGSVFGQSMNHLPTRTYAVQILNEALDTCPLFLETYRSRLAIRLSADAGQAGSEEGGQMAREREEEMLKSLETRRKVEWIPDFGFERWSS